MEVDPSFFRDRNEEEFFLGKHKDPILFIEYCNSTLIKQFMYHKKYLMNKNIAWFFFF